MDPDGSFDLSLNAIAEKEDEARKISSEYCNNKIWSNLTETSCKDTGPANPESKPGVTLSEPGYSAQRSSQSPSR